MNTPDPYQPQYPPEPAPYPAPPSGPAPGSYPPPSGTALQPPPANIPSWQLAAPPIPERPGRRWLKVAGSVLGLTGLVGGGLLAWSALGDEDPNTPEQAATAFVGAFFDGDGLGVIEQMAPGERDIVVDSVLPMFEELRRLEVLDGGFDFGAIGGIDIEAKDLTFRTELLRDDLTAVWLTGGTAKGVVDPAKLPLGKFVKRLAGEELTDVEAETVDETFDGGDPDVPMVFQRTGNRWYFSAGWTAAEAYRRTETPQGAVPAAGAALQATGAATPEDAVRELVLSGARFEAGTALALLPPDEVGALQDYAGRFLTQADEAAGEARQQASVRVPKLELSVLRRDGDTAIVGVTSAELVVDIEGGGRITYAKGCFEITEPDAAPIKQCTGDLGFLGGAGAFGLGGASALDGAEDSADGDSSAFSAEALGLPKCVDDLAAKEQPPAGIVVVERGGRWFVSPTRTMFATYTNVLKTLQPGDLDCLADTITESVGGMIDSTVTSFEESADTLPE